MLRTTAQFDLAQLPLVLAGPILRRTEPQAVTVWLALQQPCQVEIVVLPHAALTTSTPQLQGKAQTVALGKAVHIVAVTAHAIDNRQLLPDQLYAYDLRFTVLEAEAAPRAAISLEEAVRSSALPNVSISYFDHGLPTFTLPPVDLDQLKIFHGSCRKVHDSGVDALPIIDQAIAATADQVSQRPHQLFLTGDQIYGDEVADAYLWGIHRLHSELFGWTESIDTDRAINIYSKPLQPGQRQPIAESAAGLTAGLQDDAEKISSHLFSFSEYCTSYLFSWSECLWHMEFPQAQHVDRTGKAAKRWNQAVANLARTAQSQPFVRRALANIPTYMIFDDHDVSDDWNLNQAWCLRVLSQPLGRQVVRNALLAYSLFQAWGNTPEQFSVGAIGDRLLRAVQQWCHTAGQDSAALSVIEQALGMPCIDPVTNTPEFESIANELILKRTAPSLQWHYRVRGPAYEVLVLDTRTQRGYPAEQPPEAPPKLLSSYGFQHQLQPMLRAHQQESMQPPVKLTFVVAPTNVFTLEMLDRVQALGQKFGKVFDLDIGDSWNLENQARPQLMQTLLQERSQVVVLSGDIHFGAALQVDYWDQPNCNADTFARSIHPPKARLVQLIASAICNSETITEILHTKFKSLFPERIRYWAGSQNHVGEQEITPRAWWQCFNFLKSSDRNAPAENTPISWGYRSQWLRRHAAVRPQWQTSPPWLRSAPAAKPFPNVWQHLWHRRWWQEGPEVVGLNNIGLLQLDWPEGKGMTPEVIYDLYWYASWSRSPHIVYSRFTTTLLTPHR